MIFLVIGYGSIGKKHTNNLLHLDHDVVLVRNSKKNMNEQGLKEYYSLVDAISQEKRIDGAIICSPTSNHQSDVLKLLSYKIPFLLEKPPAINLKETIMLNDELTQQNFTCYDIAFNLRYYSPICFIKDYLKEIGNIYSARISAGSYLPGWRQNIDYRKTSSASKKLGGGVHIELVHEIDYINWFWGLPDKVFGYINKISNLEISTMDICSAILLYDTGLVVELHLDYLSHKNLRGCQIIGEHGTIEWNVIDNKIYKYDKENSIPDVIFKLPESYDFNETYKKELNNFISVIKNELNTNVKIEDTVNTMIVLDAIITSSKNEEIVYINNYL